MSKIVIGFIISVLAAFFLGVEVGVRMQERAIQSVWGADWQAQLSLGSDYPVSKKLRGQQ